jgi:hypothetical protein
LLDHGEPFSLVWNGFIILMSAIQAIYGCYIPYFLIRSTMTANSSRLNGILIQFWGPVPMTRAQMCISFHPKFLICSHVITGSSFSWSDKAWNLSVRKGTMGGVWRGRIGYARVLPCFVAYTRVVSLAKPRKDCCPLLLCARRSQASHVCSHARRSQATVVPFYSARSITGKCGNNSDKMW